MIEVQRMLPGLMQMDPEQKAYVDERGKVYAQRGQLLVLMSDVATQESIAQVRRQKSDGQFVVEMEGRGPNAYIALRHAEILHNRKVLWGE